MSFLDDLAGDLVRGPSRSPAPARRAPAPAPAREPITEDFAPQQVGESGYRLLIHVAAIDAQGNRVVERKALDVPKSMVATSKMLAESVEDLLGMLASTAAGGAMQAVIPSRVAGGGAATAAIGGAVAADGEGGRVGKSLEEALGLDIIEHMDAVDRGEVAPKGGQGGGPPAYVQQAQAAAPRAPMARPAGPHTRGPAPPAGAPMRFTG